MRFVGDAYEEVPVVRRRVRNGFGYAWNNVLLYVKGGGAAVADKYRTNDVVTGAEFDRASETRWGSCG